MYIDEARPPFSPFANQATILRAFARTLCFLGLSVISLTFLALYALKLGSLEALPLPQFVITILFLLIASAEVISSAVKDFKSLMPRGPYLVFLFFAMLMTAAFINKAYSLAVVPAFTMIGISVWIYKTDSFFQSTTIVDEDEELPLWYSKLRSPLSERRSAKRKRRKHKTRR